MPRRKRAVATGDREMEMVTYIFRRAFGKMEMGEWGLSEWQFDLATRCPVFKELLRQGHEHDLATAEERAARAEAIRARLPIVLLNADGSSPPSEPFVPDCFVDVSRLSAASSRPDAPSFAEWWGTDEGRPAGRPSYWAAEDRGEAGWFADWDTAAWYAHELDPENFGVEEACELLY
jgi:hypothetical protein